MNKIFKITKKLVFLVVAILVVNSFFMSNRADAAILGTFTADLTVANVVGVDNPDDPSMNISAVAQVVTFTPSSPTIGETFRATIDGTNYDYTVVSGDTVALVVAALSTAIDANANVACVNTGDIAITCTASTAGTPFTFAGSVVDVTAPTLTSVAIISNNSNNTVLAKAGDTLTVSFSTSEVLTETPTVTIAGNPADVVTNTGGNNYTATRVMQTGDADGAVAFNIAFTDSNNVAGVEVTATTNSSLVTFDKTAPTATITYSINHPVKSGNSLTISATFSEPLLDSPIVQIAISGNNTVSTVNMTKVDSTHYTYVYTVDAGDGTDTVALSAGTDATGNAVTSAPISGATFTVDNTAPVISHLGFTPNTGTRKIGDTISLTITADAVGYTTNSITVNGVATTGFLDNNNSTYSAIYTIISGHADQTAGNIPASVVLTDAAGNSNIAFTTLDANTLAIDANIPTLSSVNLSSNNSVNNLAKAGDTVNLSFTSNETISSPTVVFTSGGNVIHNSVTINNSSGNNWAASYVVDASDTDGTVSYTINFSDSVTNAGAQISSGAGGVTVDKVAPTLSGVHIISNNANNILAKTGDTITLTFTSNESAQTPVVTIAGNSAALSGGPTAWTATYTMAAGDTEEVVPFVINFSDLVGNTGTAVTAVSDASSVTFDKTAPTGLILVNSDATYTNSTNVVLDFSSVSADVVQMQLLNGTVGAFQAAIVYESPHNFTLTNSDGARAVSVRFIDSAGNQSVGVISDSIILDTTSPTAAITYSINHAVKSGNSLTITATFNEPLLDSPVAQIAVSVVNTQTAVDMTKIDSTHYTYTHIVGMGDGTATIALSIGNDLAGNVIISTPTSGASFTVDNTAPVITRLGSDPDTFVYGSTYTDAGATALDSTDGNVTNSIVTTGLVNNTTAVGAYTVHYNVSDSAGNVGTEVTRVVNITAKHITGNFVPNNKVYDGNNTATVASRSFTGVVNSDVVNLSGGTAAFGDQNVRNNKTVTLTGAILNGANSGNYILDSVATNNAAITSKSITVTAVANTKTTDGAISALNTPTISPALISGDSPSFIETYDNANVGTLKTLIPSGTVNDGNSGNNYAITFVNNTSGVILSATQVVPDNSGTVTINSTTPEVVLTNPTQAITIAVGSSTSNPTLDVHSFITSGTGTLPAITITSANANNTKVMIPSSTTVTSDDSDWDGIISAPILTTVTLPPTSGDTKTLRTAVEVGVGDIKLTFNNPVRILLKEQGGRRAGYIRDNVSFTEIRDICDTDSQNTNVNFGMPLDGEGECKMDSTNGLDLIIWTKHFTSFAAYTQVKNPRAVSIGGPSPVARTFATSETSASPAITAAPIINAPEVVKIVNNIINSPIITSLQNKDTTKKIAVIKPAPKENVTSKNKPLAQTKTETKPEKLSASVIDAPASAGFWGGVGKFFSNIFR